MYLTYSFARRCYSSPSVKKSYVGIKLETSSRWSQKPTFNDVQDTTFFFENLAQKFHPFLLVFMCSRKMEKETDVLCRLEITCICKRTQLKCSILLPFCNKLLMEKVPALLMEYVYGSPLIIPPMFLVCLAIILVSFGRTLCPVLMLNDTWISDPEMQFFCVLSC